MNGKFAKYLCDYIITNKGILINVCKKCPQDGVLSPLLWSMVVDKILVRLNDSGFTIPKHMQTI